MQPLLGLITFIALAWALSLDRRAFPWRIVITGLALQFILAFLILHTAPGIAFFASLDSAFNTLLKFANEGTSMVFGPLANTALITEKWGPQNAFIFAVTVTGTIIFVSALSSALYHYGILQLIVRAAAFVMAKVLGTSGSETLAAAANIFMGQTEAPLVIKPYLNTMTRSELLALMIGGMATIAGGVLAAYVAFGISAGHLLTASVISAPAALMMAKILLPEKEISPTRLGAPAQVEKLSVNGIDAICTGASDGMTLSINVMAMLIAFVATVALLNHFLSLALGWVGADVAQPLQLVLGWVQAPFAWLMGVPASECVPAGAILGERIVLNEFVGYLSLSQQMETLSPKTTVILTYALCGFANFSSIAIQIGGIGALAETRRADLARLGLRAMIGGLLACYCTACIASLLS
jgi:CNT family concentrative nucleoside transporter